MSTMSTRSARMIKLTPKLVLSADQKDLLKGMTVLPDEGNDKSWEILFPDQVEWLIENQDLSKLFKCPNSNCDYVGPLAKDQCAALRTGNRRLAHNVKGMPGHSSPWHRYSKSLFSICQQLGIVIPESNVMKNGLCNIGTDQSKKWINFTESSTPTLKKGRVISPKKGTDAETEVVSMETEDGLNESEIPEPVIQDPESPSPTALTTIAKPHDGNQLTLTNASNQELFSKFEDLLTKMMTPLLDTIQQQQTVIQTLTSRLDLLESKQLFIEPAPATSMPAIPQEKPVPTQSSSATWVDVVNAKPAKENVQESSEPMDNQKYSCLFDQKFLNINDDHDSNSAQQLSIDQIKLKQLLDEKTKARFQERVKSSNKRPKALTLVYVHNVAKMPISMFKKELLPGCDIDKDFIVAVDNVGLGVYEIVCYLDCRDAIETAFTTNNYVTTRSYVRHEPQVKSVPEPVWAKVRAAASKRMATNLWFALNKTRNLELQALRARQVNQCGKDFTKLVYDLLRFYDTDPDLHVFKKKTETEPLQSESPPKASNSDPDVGPKENQLEKPIDEQITKPTENDLNSNKSDQPTQDLTKQTSAMELNSPTQTQDGATNVENAANV